MRFCLTLLFRPHLSFTLLFSCPLCFIHRCLALLFSCLALLFSCLVRFAFLFSCPLCFIHRCLTLLFGRLALLFGFLVRFIHRCLPLLFGSLLCLFSQPFQGFLLLFCLLARLTLRLFGFQCCIPLLLRLLLHVMLF